MNNKEQIIIDGVDVSECVSFDKLNGQNICCYEDTREDKIPFANFCVENKDCYFKQLIRKTQECERSRKRISDLEERIINHSNEIEEYCSRLADKNKKCEKYEQALTEIEEYVRDNSDFDKSDTLTSKTGAYDILDIINKTKGR